jgi:hypothetical protein
MPHAYSIRTCNCWCSLPQNATAALHSLWQLPWQVGDHFTDDLKKSAGRSMQDAILNSPWFNYYEKLRLWHIHSKAFADFEAVVTATFDEQQLAGQQQQQQLSQSDVDWVTVLAADFAARNDPQQQEQVRRRLNWHEHCSAHLWDLHRTGKQVAGRFTCVDDLVQHAQQQTAAAGECLITLTQFSSIATSVA